MSKDKPNPFEGVRQELDLRLGGLLGELSSALSEAMERLGDADNGEVHHEHTFDGPKGPIRASAGIRIRPLGGSAAATSRQTQGRDPAQRVNTPQPPVKDAPPKPTSAPPARAINATTFENAGTWTLIAELPGISDSDLKVQSDGQELRLTAEGRGRRFEGLFQLPDGYTAESLQRSVQNGILQLSATKEDGSA